MDIDDIVVWEVCGGNISLHELKVIDAVQTMRENAFIDALIDYFTEMRNAREEEI